ncbi:pleiotropic drug resistance protein 1 [Quercus suber]|uniref:Pleiotropic drug resistance protein 1 n=1 Tax=Quercus suber TaxID=58331 RepID=A0AAW0IP25_QUESU
MDKGGILIEYLPFNIGVPAPLSYEEQLCGSFQGLHMKKTMKKLSNGRPLKASDKRYINYLKGEANEYKYRNLDLNKEAIAERLVKVAEEDNEKFLMKVRKRIDRVGIDLPTIEVRFEHLNVEAEAHVGGRALLHSLTSNDIAIGSASSGKTNLVGFGRKA